MIPLSRITKTPPRETCICEPREDVGLRSLSIGPSRTDHERVEYEARVVCADFADKYFT